MLDFIITTVGWIGFGFFLAQALSYKCERDHLRRRIGERDEFIHNLQLANGRLGDDLAEMDSLEQAARKEIAKLYELIATERATASVTYDTLCDDYKDRLNRIRDLLGPDERQPPFNPANTNLSAIGDE